MSFIERANKSIMNTYRRNPLVLVKGEGSYVFDEKGNKYLDLTGGIAVCSLGHCPKEVVEAVNRQVSTLIHTSNLYYTIPQIELAERLVSLYGEDSRIFFSNSGAEANEGAIKLARKYFRVRSQDKYEIITFKNSFHGRTYGALSATAQEKFHKGFEPMLPGFKYAILNNMDSVKSMINDNTAAIMIEPIQGEGGVNACERDFLLDLKKLCDERGLLLIFDEIQTGVGRTGNFFCFEHYGIKPHIVTLAKGIAGGLPMGAIIARADVACVLEPGTHATTFGGSPVICAAANAVIDRISERGFLDDVYKKGQYIEKRLTEFKKAYPLGEIKGIGLLRGVELNIKDPSIVIHKGIEMGLLLNLTAGNILRILPPLTININEIEEFCQKFESILEVLL